MSEATSNRDNRLSAERLAELQVLLDGADMTGTVGVCVPAEDFRALMYAVIRADAADANAKFMIEQTIELRRFFTNRLNEEANKPGLLKDYNRLQYVVDNIGMSIRSCASAKNPVAVAKIQERLRTLLEIFPEVRGSVLRAEDATQP